MATTREKSSAGWSGKGQGAEIGYFGSSFCVSQVLKQEPVVLQKPHLQQKQGWVLGHWPGLGPS